ncbi:hypothetical protein M1N57_00185 [Dehalococcoidales bacterium]|nr:hypothetical protein [Dehalococcoidales bacterium]
MDERLKFVISKERGFEAGLLILDLLSLGFRKIKSLVMRDFNHPEIIATIKTILEKQRANFSRIFIVIDEFDKLDVGEEEDFKVIKNRILQDIRAVFSIEGVYFILIGLEKHFQLQARDEKTIEDSTFDDIIYLKFDDRERHHFLSEVLEKRLKWLHLNTLFAESGKEEMIKRAKSSPRELIRLLSKAIAYWVNTRVYRFDQEAVKVCLDRQKKV